jgi:CRISPR system Cascade subunit CasE
MTEDLYIVRLLLDRRELIRVATRHRLPYGVDDGYLLHAGLAQLFAKGSAPAEVPFLSFAVDDTNPRARAELDRVYLLAYSALAEGALNEEMGPARRAMVHACATRPVPVLAAGTRARFRTRVCPVVRTKRVGDRPLRVNKKGWAVSREVDAWLAERFQSWQEQPHDHEAFPSDRRAREWHDRERVYVKWLGREVGRSEGAELEPGARMESFQRDAVHRGGSPRVERKGTMQRPNVVLEGTLRVTQTEGFRAVLARGVGRHRAFGFGMLLLRPA